MRLCLPCWATFGVVGGGGAVGGGVGVGVGVVGGAGVGVLVVEVLVWVLAEGWC